MIFAIPVAFTLSILANIFPSFKIWATFLGVSASLLDATIWESVQLSLKQSAARVQEIFDCTVLGIEWHSSRVGARPDPETIAAAAATDRRKHPNDANLRDWYAISVGKLPMELGRLICQRTNCQWDSHLRGRYSQWLLAILAGFAILVVGFGLHNGMTLERFVLAIFAPLSPAFLWGIREWKKQRAAADSGDRLKSHVNEIWTKALAAGMTTKQLETESRDLQDEIYERRRSNPLIFDWIYYLLRDSQEQQANRAAEELVEEALQSIKKTS